MRLLMVSLAVACGTSACNTGVSCDTGVEPAIVLTVLDDGTGLRLEDATAAAVLGAQTYPLEGESGTGNLYLWRQAGTYVLTARRTGYVDWVRTVVVRDAGSPCPGAITQSIEARMQSVPD